ncbi:MAG: FtsH protease activity modulator HflK [Candidatus Krumholzibacteriota bacterium]|nr:FtsH protease activity modulator HflK [Candidatus Krumholzibacteriota bacterium]
MKVQVGDKEYSWSGGKIRNIIAAVIVIILVASGFYSIDADETGVVMRFGKFVRQTQPGLHIKIPLGVESVTKIKVKKVFKQEFGFRTLQASVRTRYSSRTYTDESIMLTGDLNVAEVEWIVQYRIEDAYNYIFKIKDTEETLRTMSEAVTRKVVGDRTVTGVLTKERVEIAQEVQDELQGLLDYFEAGIHIVTVKFQDVNPPEPVRPAFNDVNSAKQDKSKMINQGWESYNNRIPRAKGEAEQLISEAKGYALKRVNRAKGDVALFNNVYREYRKAPSVTRRRLYLEAMNEVLPKVEQIFIIDEEQEGILPHLDLGGNIKGGEGR